ncbi:MAG: hypothetical protein ACJAUP_003329 [Cellvibrionaceae bacterium]
MAAATTLEEGEARLTPNLDKQAEGSCREAELFLIKGKFLDRTRKLVEQEKT